MDPSLSSPGAEELKVMLGAALNLNRRVISAGDNDGNRLGEAGVPGARDRYAWCSRCEKTVRAVGVALLHGQFTTMFSRHGGLWWCQLLEPTVSSVQPRCPSHESAIRETHM